jgi:LPXTG-motif cell wall-anchored protein
MDDKRFDAFVRSLAEGASRRGVLKGMLGGLVGGAALSVGMSKASADEETPPDDGTPISEETAVEETIDETPADEVPVEDSAETQTSEETEANAATGCTYDCGPCGYCVNGSCWSECDEAYCCSDDKGGHYCLNAEAGQTCCDSSYCDGCEVCYGGYCIDSCGPKGQVCCGLVEIEEGKNDGPYCAECCEHWDCGPCQECDRGHCVDVCRKGELCCDWEEASFCAEECCDDSQCGSCEYCYEGLCYPDSGCDPYSVCCANGDYPYCAHPSEGCCGGRGDWCEVQVAAGAGTTLDGTCCDELNCCYDDKTKSATCAECCDDDHCPEGYQCCGGNCAECCSDKDCEKGEYCVSGYCSECRNSHDCPKDYVCCDGYCSHGVCCEGGDECGFCEECHYGECELQGNTFGEACSPYQISAADGSPQLSCCDGLFCCETGKYDDPLVCLQCCGDNDCAKGCHCDHGVCSCPCGSDYDCAKGTCCCKNGSCSADCCKHDKPDHPGGGKGDDDPGKGVHTLPSTGAGDNNQSAAWLGAAALGAAAFLASKALKADDEDTEAATS